VGNHECAQFQIRAEPGRSCISGILIWISAPSDASPMICAMPVLRFANEEEILGGERNAGRQNKVSFGDDLSEPQCLGSSWPCAKRRRTVCSALLKRTLFPIESGHPDNAKLVPAKAAACLTASGFTPPTARSSEIAPKDFDAGTTFGRRYRPSCTVGASGFQYDRPLAGLFGQPCRIQASSLRGTLSGSL